MKLPVTVDPRYHDGVIFDLDGVVTDTASIHAAAWTTLFNDFLARRPAEGGEGEDHAPFTDADYRHFIDGKPRFDGVADFLKSRGISMPWGSDTDDTDDTVCGLGNRKQQLFLDRLADGVPVFQSTVELVRQLQDVGIRTAVFSSSRNCEQILRAAGIADLFSVRVDGVAKELGVSGKPNPAVILETANRLRVRPDRCVVVEDAEAGVTAGRDGGFALVIGVDRTGHVDDLFRSGADVVVADLVAVTLRAGYEPMSALMDVLEGYGEIATLIATRKPLVLLDFDGTLSEIVNDPDAATLVPGASKALRVVGCPLSSRRAQRPRPGRHRRPGGLARHLVRGQPRFRTHRTRRQPSSERRGDRGDRVLEAAAAELRNRLGRIDGILVENKRFSVAVHYRKVAPERVGEVTAAVRIIGRRNGLRVTSGRKVIELRPDLDWDKGKTLEWLVDRIDGPGPLLPIYIGDDLTDEDAFDAVRHNGIGIVVRHGEDGDRRSSARFALDSPDAVRQFIGRLAAQLATEYDVPNNPWTMTFGGYEPSDERLREALCTMGNGYFAVRGCAPESRAAGVHYPGTYVAGIYNRLTDQIAGSTVDNESMVNLPNWLPLTFRIDGGVWFDIDDTTCCPIW